MKYIKVYEKFILSDIFLSSFERISNKAIKEIKAIKSNKIISIDKNISDKKDKKTFIWNIKISIPDRDFKFKFKEISLDVIFTQKKNKYAVCSTKLNFILEEKVLEKNKDYAGGHDIIRISRNPDINFHLSRINSLCINGNAFPFKKSENIVEEVTKVMNINFEKIISYIDKAIEISSNWKISNEKAALIRKNKEKLIKDKLKLISDNINNIKDYFFEIEEMCLKNEVVTKNNIVMLRYHLKSNIANKSGKIILNDDNINILKIISNSTKRIRIIIPNIKITSSFHTNIIEVFLMSDTSIDDDNL